MHYVTSEHYAKIRAIVQYERDSAKRSVNGRDDYVRMAREIMKELRDERNH